MTKALFVGRFQPFHVGHLAAIQHAAKKHDFICVGLGSTNMNVSKHNPFTTEEREKMIQNSLQDVIPNFEIYYIPDIGNNKKWAVHAISHLPSFDVVYSGSPLIRKLFRDKGYEVHEVPFTNGANGTQIREKIYSGEPWGHLIPPGALDVIKSLNGAERIINLMDRPTFRNPLVTVDALIKYKGQLAFIRRGRYPFKGKLAFAGGHVDYGETCENAVVREVEEETGLKFEIEGLVAEYSDPDRDPRGHYVTLLYVGTATGELKAGDDAADVKLIPIAQATELDLAFDHSRMLKDAIKKEALKPK